jgi:hypothetical protein
MLEDGDRGYPQPEPTFAAFFNAGRMLTCQLTFAMLGPTRKGKRGGHEVSLLPDGQSSGLEVLPGMRDPAASL